MFSLKRFRSSGGGIRSSTGQSPPAIAFPRRHIPQNVFLFTNARDEPSIIEWAFYHLRLGFTHVFIYDHQSRVPISTLLVEYADKRGDESGNGAPHDAIDYLSRITVHRVSEFSAPSQNIKIPLMNAALRYSIQHLADWMLYLDADEYLTINPAVFRSSSSSNLNDDNENFGSDFDIEESSFSDTSSQLSPLFRMLSVFYFADTLAINWLMFGSSGYDEQPTKGLLINNFIKSDSKLNAHVKTFVRPQHVRAATNPHYFPAVNTNRAFAVTGSPIDQSTAAFNWVDMEFKNAPAYIAHYVVQSKQEFHRRKGRPMDDGTGDKTGLYAGHDFHKVHNECDNEQLKERIGLILEDELFNLQNN